MKHEELTEKLREISDSLGEDGVMVCVFKAGEGGQSILIHGRKKNIIGSLALALHNDDFREYIKLASKVNLLATTILPKIFGTEEDKENTRQEADRLAKDFLRNNGFKMEGE